MAMEVISEIRAAEEKALEIRRLAALAAKDALKLAEQQNAEILEKEISTAQQSSADKISAAMSADKTELDALLETRLTGCAKLKSNAQQRLDHAAQICLKRILE